MSTTNLPAVCPTCGVPQTPAPGNTHVVGISGLISVFAGIFGPVIVNHVLGRAAPDVQAAFTQFFSFLAGGGLMAVYFGMPLTVKR